MSREDVIKAIAAGLQPKSLDLTKFAPAKSASRVRSTQSVANDTAAYALGFGAGAITVGAVNGVGGELQPGDPLAVALLRLKYAEQLSMRGFERALLLLLLTVDAAKRDSDTMRAVATASLVEWLNDRCPKCRSPRERALQPHPCLACGQRREKGQIMGRPTAGCPKCHGMGRIFQTPEAPKGMVCHSCVNSGIVYWRAKRRWRTVSELIVEDQRAREVPVRGLDLGMFERHWMGHYRGFLAVLRKTDRRMGATVDLRMNAKNRRDLVLEGLDPTDETCTIARIESGREENQDASPLERAGETPLQTPE